MEETNSTAPSAAAEPRLEFEVSRHFTGWMAEQGISLVFTTYQSGKLFLLGTQPDGRLSVFERSFSRSMGLWGTGQTLYLSSQYQVWRMENCLDAGADHNGYDRLYVPRVAHTTGDLDAHDLAIDGTGRLVFVNTLFSCLATVSEVHSFTPIWKPQFISRLAAEDRCHLNGLAMENGKPRYVTSVGQTDICEGWRDRRRDGGVVIDVQSNEVVLPGLSMPHSPRCYRDQLWMLDSGSGRFGKVDLKRGIFDPVTFCRGYLRGLTFWGDYAVVGLSGVRENRTFSGLPLDDSLKRHGVAARCGLDVIDLRTGDVVHEMRIEGIVSELYDVVVLPGVRRPMALGLKTDEIQRVIRIGPFEPLS